MAEVTSIEEGTGNGGYGTVAQIPRTAVDEACASSADEATLGFDTLFMPQEQQETNRSHTLCILTQDIHSGKNLP